MVSLVYWWMLPVSICVATVAMTFGVEGAVMFSPIFVVAFPLLGVPTLTPPMAFGSALLTEFVGFTSGLIGYLVQRIINWRIGLRLVALGIPLGILGALLKGMIAAPILILLFASTLLLLAGFVAYGHHEAPTVSVDMELPNVQLLSAANGSDTSDSPRSQLPASCERATILGVALVAVGSLMTGIISVGIGESTVSVLHTTFKLPMRVAAATSVMVTYGVVAGASITTIIQVGAGGIPWDLVMFTGPGVLIGAQIGARLSSKLRARVARQLLIALLVFLSLVMFVQGLHTLHVF